MGRSPGFSRPLLVKRTRWPALATAIVFLCAAAHPVEAAPKKKKKKKPAPAATTTVELDATPPAVAPAPATTPPPPAATPAPATTPAPAAAPASDAAAEPEAGATPVAAPHDAFSPLGAKHTLVLDDLSGFRASTVGGIAYAGPIGFSTQSFSVNVYGATGAVAGTDTIHSTTIWFAPSADYFLFEHLSIGAVIEIAWNSASYTESIYGTASQNQSLPSTTNVTVIPRVGYMFSLAEKWGLWPRLGLGFGLLQENAINQAGGGNPTTASSSPTFLLDADLGILYRLDSRFYLRAGPEFTWGPGASLVDFSVAGGFGYMWSL